MIVSFSIRMLVLKKHSPKEHYSVRGDFCPDRSSNFHRCRFHFGANGDHNQMISLFLAWLKETNICTSYHFRCQHQYFLLFCTKITCMKSQLVLAEWNNVTGPPGALLFDRDQRSHWNKHYNCCFVQVATLGIYCTVFLPQLIIQIKYPMQSVGHHIWQ